MIRHGQFDVLEDIALFFIMASGLFRQDVNAAIFDLV
jgi:hypothetical protein